MWSRFCFICSLHYFRSSRRFAWRSSIAEAIPIVFHASDFYIWPGPTLFCVWPNKIPQAFQKEVQDRSSVWLEFAQWSRFRRVTYFRAASGYTYLDAPVIPPLFVLLFWFPTIVESEYRICGRRGSTPTAIHAYIRVLLRGLHPRLNPRRLRLGDEWIISARSRKKISNLYCLNEI